MADPDESIAASPSALLAAAGAQRSAATQLRAVAAASFEPGAVGDPAAADALRGAAQAVLTMARACADGADDLGGALVQAQTAYALADAVAVPGVGAVAGPVALVAEVPR